MSDIVQKILVCPLNWGLGHASRCVPVIRMFLDRGHEVHIGSDGIALDLLRVEFPNLPFVDCRDTTYNTNTKALQCQCSFSFLRC
jgi:UDP:flavonoid glycosyltransferase YjiC (YdhE family)